MLVKWAIDALSWAVAGILTALGALIPDPPSWVNDGMTKVAELYQYAGAFESWIPVPLALTILGFILTVNAVVVGMMLVRMGVSYATFGGGTVSK